MQSMEMGGNARVNAIFEANLGRMGVNKPSNLARGPEREKFIRDKYERRKFYDPAGYSQDPSEYSSGQVGGPPAAPTTSSSHATRPGAPSEAARQRVASRQARMKPAHSGDFDQPSAAASARPKVAPAPVSAPVLFDLLDFSAEPASAPAPAPQGSHDPFSAPSAATTTSQPIAAASDPFAAGLANTAPVQQVQPQQQAPQPQTQQQQPAPASNNSALSDFACFATPNPSAAPVQQKQVASNNDIMALFNKPTPQTSFGMQGMGGAMMGMMGNQQPGSGGMMGGYNNPMMQQQAAMAGGGMNPMQMQQMMMMGNQQMMANPQMMGMMNSGGMPQQQAMMMQQQGNQQKMMMANNPQQGNQQNMMMANNPQMMMGGGMMGANMANNGAAAGGNFNSMMQGMAQMSMGQPQQLHSQQSNDAGDGFGGGAMGGGAVGAGNGQNSDPFSALGGMNAFR